MSLRMRISDALKQAMKDKAADRLSTLRLINAAIKDKDIAARANGKDEGVSDAEVLGILSKMAKQRQESARAYEEGGSPKPPPPWTRPWPMSARPRSATWARSWGC